MGKMTGFQTGKKAYFFAGSKYIRVTRGEEGPGTVDPNYPKPISEWGWREFGKAGIDAAFQTGKKAYFFAGSKYIRVTRGEEGPGTVDPNYPKPIREWGWPDVFIWEWLGYREIHGLLSLSAIVVDRASGQVIGAKNPDERRAMASTTKIMTGLLATEALDSGKVKSNDIITIRKSDLAEGGGHTDLTIGDHISLIDLLHALLLKSCNYAAVTIARHVAGSREAFLKSMNKRAKELGLANTCFVTVSGRDPEDYIEGCKGDDFDNPLCAHYTTSRDLASLFRYALSNKRFIEIAETQTWKTTTWQADNGSRKDTVWNNQVNDFYSRHLGKCNHGTVYAGKGGNTNCAHHCLVAAARCDARDVISVLLGLVETDTYNSFDESVKIIDFGFAFFDSI
jgi:D-alanyl-D-alanine carboxypeptidase